MCYLFTPVDCGQDIEVKFLACFYTQLDFLNLLYIKKTVKQQNNDLMNPVPKFLWLMYLEVFVFVYKT